MALYGFCGFKDTSRVGAGMGVEINLIANITVSEVSYIRITFARRKEYRCVRTIF